MHYFFAILIMPLLLSSQIGTISNSSRQDTEQINNSLEIQHQKQLDVVFKKLGNTTTLIANLASDVATLGNKMNSTQAFEQNLVSEINQSLTMNQQRNEEVQLLDTSAQVSGIFIAIIGGFFTTKTLSMSTERNRLFRQLDQLGSTINTKNELIDYNQNIMDRISITWAEWEIDYFKADLLGDEKLKAYSENEIIDKFYEYKQKHETLPNEYEIAILEDQYNTISQEIQKKIEKKKNLFLIDTSSFITSLVTSHSRPNLLDEYNDAMKKSTTESFEKDQLISQKNQIEAAIDDIILPEITTRGIGVLFSALLIGIVLPLYFSSQLTSYGQYATMIGISSFLSCVLITIIYFGRELRKDLQKFIRTTTKNP